MNWPLLVQVVSAADVGSAAAAALTRAEQLCRVARAVGPGVAGLAPGASFVAGASRGHVVLLDPQRHTEAAHLFQNGALQVVMAASHHEPGNL